MQPGPSANVKVDTIRKSLVDTLHGPQMSKTLGHIINYGRKIQLCPLSSWIDLPVVASNAFDNILDSSSRFFIQPYVTLWKFLPPTYEPLIEILAEGVLQASSRAKSNLLLSCRNHADKPNCVVVMFSFQHPIFLERFIVHWE